MSSLKEIPQEILKLPTYRLDIPEGYSNSNDFRLVVREDTNEIVALVSSKYLLIQPRLIFAKVYEQATKMGSIKKLLVYYTSAKQYMELLFAESLEAKDSRYFWGIRAINSVDGSRIFTVHFILWRLSCRNDLFLMGGLGVMHISSNKLKVSNFIVNLPRMDKPYLEKLIEVNEEDILTRRSARRIFKDFPRYIIAPARRVLDKEGELSRWELINLLSRQITDIMKPMKRANLLEKLSKHIIYP